MLSAEAIISGSHLAAARAIRMIEDKDPDAAVLLKELYPHSGNAFIIGITGSPGVGKSTLIAALIRRFRDFDKKVAVIAIDPTSPYSGGAVLGDRIRMQQHADDDRVFIRSMASRGQQGGLSRATKDAAVVLDAMGFDIILIETVGAGQAQFDINRIAHSVGVVTIPGAGDGIQAVKAGILETGDLFIVNKCDHPDADTAVHQLEAVLDMKPPASSEDKAVWLPQIFKTMARSSQGVEELAQGFLAHFQFMKKNGEFEKRKAFIEKAHFKNLVEELAIEKIEKLIHDSREYETALETVLQNKSDPMSAAFKVMERVCNF